MSSFIRASIGEMSYTSSVVCALLVVLVCGAEDDITANNCVAEYEEFEKKTFDENTHNRYSLYQIFYPQNQRSPYTVDIIYQTFGVESEIIHEDPIRFCNITRWRWTSSPIFLFTRPKYLNRVLFYTLNYFRELTTPSVTLKVPYPCPNSTILFLSQMTSLVDGYAVHGTRAPTGRTSGGVIGLCTNKNLNILDLVPLKEEMDNAVFRNIMSFAYYIGFLFGVSLVLIGSVVVLKQYLRQWVELNRTYSYKHYGLWWGVTCIAIMVVPGALYLDMTAVLVSYPEYGAIAKSISSILLLGLGLLPGIPIAVYFTYRTEPPAVPYIILTPFTIFYCCCGGQRVKSLVFGVVLWINIVLVTGLMFHGLLLILGLFVEPMAVITNTLVLILATSCAIHILASLFTISAYIFPPKDFRPQGPGKTMQRAVLLIPLLGMITCLCLSYGSLGYLINRETIGEAVSLVRSWALPIFLGAVTFGLNKFTTMWLDSPHNGQQREYEDMQ